MSLLGAEISENTILYETKIPLKNINPTKNTVITEVRDFMSQGEELTRFHTSNHHYTIEHQMSKSIREIFGKPLSNKFKVIFLQQKDDTHRAMAQVGMNPDLMDLHFIGVPLVLPSQSSSKSFKLFSKNV